MEVATIVKGLFAKELIEAGIGIIIIAVVTVGLMIYVKAKSRKR